MMESKDPVFWLNWKMQLVLLFLLGGMCFSFGYASCARWNPASEEGNDAKMYSRMAEDNPEVQPPFRYRILTPALAKAVMPVMAKVPHGTWNVTGMSFLLVNSFFLTLAGFCLAHIAFLLLRDRIVAVMASILFISSFTAVNQYLAGMVDAAEAFFLAAIVLGSLRGWWRAIPFLLGVGALGKETTFIQGTTWLVCYTLALWIRNKQLNRQCFLSVVVSILVGFGVLLVTHTVVGGAEYSSHRFSFGQILGIPREMAGGFISRSNVFAFLLLLPLGLPRLRRIPSPYLPISLIMGGVALVASSYAQIGATNYSRPLFNAIGPLLCISSALYLADILKLSAKKDRSDLCINL